MADLKQRIPSPEEQHFVKCELMPFLKKKVQECKAKGLSPSDTSHLFFVAIIAALVQEGDPINTVSVDSGAYEFVLVAGSKTDMEQVAGALEKLGAETEVEKVMDLANTQGPFRRGMKMGLS